MFFDDTDYSMQSGGSNKIYRKFYKKVKRDNSYKNERHYIHAAGIRNSSLIRGYTFIHAQTTYYK